MDSNTKLFITFQATFCVEEILNSIAHEKDAVPWVRLIEDRMEKVAEFVEEKNQ